MKFGSTYGINAAIRIDMSTNMDVELVELAKEEPKPQVRFHRNFIVTQLDIFCDVIHRSGQGHISFAIGIPKCQFFERKLKRPIPTVSLQETA